MSSAEPISRCSSIHPGHSSLDILCFAGIDLHDRTAIGAKRRTIEAEPFDPWSGTELAEQCRTLVRLLHDGGVVLGDGAASQGAPRIDTGWTLFVRRKRPDYQGYLDRMRELYVGGAEAPDALRSLVIDAPSSLASSDESEWTAAETEPLLLPLASNEDQQRILRLAQVQSGVVVQGPPGTGKSHTIANLISHYVAYGHRVLVVAEKEQALRVLADKIPREIADLTVSVLGADRASQAALESSIQAIQSRVSGMDKKAEDQRIDELTAELQGVDAAIAMTVGRLMAAREAESRRLAGSWPCGPDPHPGEVAAWLHEHEDALSFIPDEIDSSVSPALTAGELAELLRLLNEVGIERARESAFILPPLLDVPVGTKLTEYWADLRALDDDLATLDGTVEWRIFDAADPAAIQALRANLDRTVGHSRACDEPWLETVATKLADPLLAHEWSGFLKAVTDERERAVALRGGLSAHTVAVNGAGDPQFRQQLAAVRAKLADKGKLGMFNGELKQVLAQCSIDGRPATSAADIDLCLAAHDLAEVRRSLQTRWNAQIGPVHGPTLEQERPEEEVGRRLGQLVFVQGRASAMAMLRAEAASVGLRLSAEDSTRTLEAGLAALAQTDQRPRQLGLRTYFEDLRGYLRRNGSEAETSPHWVQLADAFDGRDADAWDAVRADVASLEEVAPRARRLVELRDRLHESTPLWCERILVNSDAANDPALVVDAWRWRQMQTWLDEIHRGDSPADLQRRIEELQVKRRSVITTLVGVRAWRRLADNLGDKQRQALNAYLTAVRRYGKTGGKFAARWLEEIRRALNESKDAVPVWIMPTSRALTSFRPDASVPFDVIIVDEASQIDVTALPLLALARRAIVVGDDKQTSPGTVGTDQERVFELIDTHLAAIPHSRTLFNVGNSLYDMAFQKFPRSVMLREHFRCLPEIIGFSNRMYYGGLIEPLRDQRPRPNWPALGAVKVLDGFRARGGVNVPEAQAVVDLIAELIDDPAYAGMTFGVVCLLGGGQADLVRAQLFDRVGPSVWEDRRIRVGDAANFQGDERDVMVVALVAATDPTNPGSRIGALTSVADGQRVNVAASRARNQMWIVHSLEPERFPNGDPRAELIRHSRDPQTFDDAIDGQLAQCDSEFERMVIRQIVTRGYRRVRSQVHVGTENHSYRIDLVVEGPQSRLAIECDGEQWHGPERWHADRARQEILERAGWTFVRIRGSEYFRNPSEAMERVWARLTELNIPSGDEWLLDAAAASTTRREVYGLGDPSTDAIRPAMDDEDSADADVWDLTDSRQLDE